MGKLRHTGGHRGSREIRGGGHGKLGSRVQPKVTQVVLGTAEPGMLSGPGLPPAVTHPCTGAQLLRLQAQTGLP